MNADIRCDVIKSFYSYIYDDDRREELRLVQWTINGRKGDLIFEKREWFKTKDGKPSNRCVGFKREDLYRLITYLPNLSEIMKFPIQTEAIQKALTAVKDEVAK